MKRSPIALSVAMILFLVFAGASPRVATAENLEELPRGGAGVGVDWKADLVIGVASEDLGLDSAAGGVHVLYGSSSGPTTATDDWWTEDVPGVDETASQERFGQGLAAGDFNGDGRTDLAIGAPGEDANGVADAGAVFVFYATDDGLSTTGLQIIHQDTAGMPDAGELGDFFGETLSSGDYNKDGYWDLAVCAKYKGVAGVFGAGAVYVLYGSSSGLTTTGSQFIHQNLSGVAEDPEYNAFFGETLTSGDVNGDGYVDLVIGADNHDTVGGQTQANSGAIYVLYGQWYGLRTSWTQMLTQDTISVSGVREMNDHFGAALAAGDFDGDGFDDIAVGVPDEDVTTGDGAQADAGVIHIFYGSEGAIATADELMLIQTEAGGATMAAELFGYALSSGDFDGDGYADLAIGAPGELSSSGSVNVMYGSASGLGSGELWRQGSYSALFDEAENGDYFGASLAAGDFDGDGFDDLVVGVPFEDFGTTQDVGVLHVIFGTVSGLTNVGDLYFHQLYSGIGGDGPEEGDYFSRTLAVISRSELIFADGFESGNLVPWGIP